MNRILLLLSSFLMFIAVCVQGVDAVYPLANSFDKIELNHEYITEDIWRDRTDSTTGNT